MQILYKFCITKIKTKLATDPRSLEHPQFLQAIIILDVVSKRKRITTRDQVNLSGQSWAGGEAAPNPL